MGSFMFMNFIDDTGLSREVVPQSFFPFLALFLLLLEFKPTRLERK
jgi:hypothetical protein